MARLGNLLTKEKKATDASAGCVLITVKSVPAGRNMLDSEEGKDRSQQEGREESKLPLLILCLPFRSRELAHLTAGLNKKSYWKSSDLLSFLPSKHSLFPLRLHPEHQLLKTIALLHHIDCSWGVVWVRFFWCWSTSSASLVSVSQTVFSSSTVNILRCRYKIYCLEEDLPDWKPFWSDLWSVRNRPYKSDEGCCHRASFTPFLTLQQLLCALKTKKCLVNLEEMLRKFRAERWRVRAL